MQAVMQAVMKAATEVCRPPHQRTLLAAALLLAIGASAGCSTQTVKSTTVTAIVTEAGGKWTNRHGEANWRSDSLITSNGRLHGAVLSALESDR